MLPGKCIFIEIKINQKVLAQRYMFMAVHVFETWIVMISFVQKFIFHFSFLSEISLLQYYVNMIFTMC